MLQTTILFAVIVFVIVTLILVALLLFIKTKLTPQEQLKSTSTREARSWR